MENKRIEELERLLTSECPKYETNCSRCPYNKECQEYEKLYNK